VCSYYDFQLVLQWDWNSLSFCVVITVFMMYGKRELGDHANSFHGSIVNLCSVLCVYGTLIRIIEIWYRPIITCSVLVNKYEYLSH
jgi:hypothetical protein